MPYTTNKELPKSVQKLPNIAQNMFRKTFNTAFSKYGEEKAFKIAWAAVKKRFKKVKDKWVAKTSDFTGFMTIRYVFNPNEAIIGKSSNGRTLVEYIMSGSDIDRDGQKWDDFALKRFAEQINEEGLSGYLSDGHEALMIGKEKNLSPEEIEEYVKSLNTGIKAIQARYEQGKLYSTIEVPNEMVDVVKDMGISIEARVPMESIIGNTLKQGRLTGFIFTGNPSYANSGIVI